MPRPEGRPDAVKFPQSWKEGKRASDRYESLIEIAEVLLEVDFEKGEGAWYRLQLKDDEDGSDYCFATRSKSIVDTLLFPDGHPLKGSSRYEWFKNEDGTSFGWLTDDAKEELLNVEAAIALRERAVAETIEKLNIERQKYRARRKGAASRNVPGRNSGQTR